MKKIVLVTDAWHPQVNGVVTVFENIIPQLTKRGYTVVVIHPGLFWTVPLPTYFEVKISIFPRRTIRRILAAERPDYVHIATEGALGWSARSLCRSLRLPFTTSYHTHFHLYLERRIPKTTRVGLAYLRLFHNYSARVMAAIPSLKARLEKNGFRNVVLWPLGVDTTLFARTTTPSVPDLAPPVFAYFGRIAPEKDTEEFLRLKLPGTKLVIGDGPDRTKFERKYQDVRFVGMQKGQHLVDWLSRVNVVVLPSRTETFGLSSIEALACGIPIAAHDAMGPRDIITDGVDGVISEDLTQAALRCLQLDPAKCREKAMRYTWGASADAFVRNLVPVVRDN